MRRVGRVGWPLTALGAAVAVAVIAGTVHLQYPGPWLMTLLVAIGCLALLAYSAATDGDPLSPLMLLALAFIVLFVLRPAYILSAGVTGPTRRIDDQPLTAKIAQDMTVSSSLVLLAIVGLLVGAFCYRAINPMARGEWRSARTRIADLLNREQLASGAALAAVVVTGLLALYGYYELISAAGGVSEYVASLSVRSQVFYGKGYLAQIALPLKAVSLVILAFWATRPDASASRRLTVAGLILAVMVGDFLTGGRSALLLGTLIPLAALQHYLRSPLRLRVIVPLLLFAVVFFVGSRVATRDSVYASADGSSTSAHSIVEITGDQLSNLSDSTIGGRDAVPYDGVVRLVGAHGTGQQLLYGSTYLPILTFIVPRAFWADKPGGGANTWFTSKFYPEFYGPQHTETSVSEIGELYANFGPAGVLGGFFLLGALVTALYQRLVRARRMWHVLLYPATMTSVITLVRGDAFHSITTWALTVGVMFLALRCISVRAGSSQRSAERAVADARAPRALPTP